jgi:cytochrome c biogenesis protein ResB
MISHNKRKGGNFSPTIFVPGIVFLVLGLAVVFAPRLFLLIMASVLVSIGVGLCFLAWKFIQFRRKLQTLSRTFEEQIKKDPRFQSEQRFQGVKVVGSYTVNEGEEDDSYETTKTSDKDGNITYH